jgi:hypothetical protein
MAAAPTWVEIWAQIRHRILQLKTLDTAANAATPNWLGKEDDILQSLEGRFVSDAIASLNADRNRISEILSPANVGVALAPFVRELGNLINATERQPAAIMERLRQYMNGVGRASGTITAATAANPVVITSAGHGLPNGSLVYLTGLGGMVELNGRYFKTANATTDTFELAGENGEGHTTYTSGGTWSQRDAVAAQVFTFGTPSAASGNVGNGAIYRTTVDSYGNSLEATHAEARRVEVIQDQGQVNRHEEVLLFQGAAASPDFLKVTGSGGAKARAIAAVAMNEYDRWVRNSTFNTLSGTQPSAGSPVTPAAVTSITGWTLDATTSVTVGVSSPAPYRTHRGETAPKWVRFGVNRSMSQAFDSTTRARFVDGVPYFVAVVVRREGSCDGTFTLTLGGVSRAIIVASALTNDVNTVVPLVVSATDMNRYYRNFKQENLTLTLALSSRTTGTLFIHEVQFAPMQPWDGTWYLPVGGSTPWLLQDKLTFTDSVAAVKNFSYWFWRAGLGHLVTIGDSLETISES